MAQRFPHVALIDQKRKYIQDPSDGRYNVTPEDGKQRLERCKKCEGSIKNSRVCFASDIIYSRVTFGIFNNTDTHVAVSKLRMYDSGTYYMVLMISLFTLLEA